VSLPARPCLPVSQRLWHAVLPAGLQGLLEDAAGGFLSEDDKQRARPGLDGCRACLLVVATGLESFRAAGKRGAGKVAGISYISCLEVGSRGPAQILPHKGTLETETQLLTHTRAAGGDTRQHGPPRIEEAQSLRLRLRGALTAKASR